MHLFRATKPVESNQSANSVSLTELIKKKAIEVANKVNDHQQKAPNVTVTMTKAYSEPNNVSDLTF